MTLSDTQPFIRELQAAIDATRRERAALHADRDHLYELRLYNQLRLAQSRFEQEIYHRVFNR